MRFAHIGLRYCGGDGEYGSVVRYGRPESRCSHLSKQLRRIALAEVRSRVIEHRIDINEIETSVRHPMC